LRVAIFVWLATLGKILILDNLRKHLIVVDWCFMCKKNGGSVDHLLHCEITCALWSSIFGLFGLKWVMPRWVVGLFVCWRGQCCSSQRVVVWKMILFCLMWCISREISCFSFEDCRRTVVKLEAFFFKTLYTGEPPLSASYTSINDFLSLFSFSI
jgi:hypothetical protein